MKKLLTLLATLAFAASLAVPGFAAPKKAAQQDTAATSNKATTKKHRRHSHKKGAKNMQKSTTPAQK